MNNILKFLFIFLIILCLCFIIFPIFHIFITLCVKRLLKTLYDREVWMAILTSFEGACLATILGCILGVPIAYLLSRYEFIGKRLLESIVNLPIAIPHVAVGIALLSFLNERTVLGNLFLKFHITFVDTIYGVVIAMAFVSISYVITSALIGFNATPRELEMVSRSLGASAPYTFFHIVLPLSMPAIIRGAILAFARSVSEIGALLILSYYPKTAPIIMYERFEQYGLEAARPVTALVVFLSLLIFFLLLFLSQKRWASARG